MNRLFVLLAIVAVVAVTGWAALAARAEDRPAEDHAKHFDACAKVCSECQVVCERNFHHCATRVAAGKFEHTKAMLASVDCADFCTLSAKLTGRHSVLAVAACEACEKACLACAAECAKFPDNADMKSCAEMCKKCAASCREMVKMAMH